MPFDISICIPTYDRADFLELCLERLLGQLGDRQNIEIVVSNNASADGTAALLDNVAAREPRMRVVHRTSTLPVLDHYIQALLLGEGRWCTVVADDDFINLEVLLDHVRYADSDPDIVAVYADWIAWDDQQRKELHRYYAVGPEPLVFDANKAVDLANFVFSRQVHPEVGLYRRRELTETVAPASREAFFHSFLYRRLRQGKVAFVSQPFYYECLAVQPHLVRTHWAHIDLQTTTFDHARSDLEAFLLNLLALAGQHPLGANRLIVHDMITSYLLNRMELLRLKAIGAGHWRKALEFDNRIRLWFPERALPFAPAEVTYGTVVMMASCESVRCLIELLPDCAGAIVDDRVSPVAKSLREFLREDQLTYAALDTFDGDAAGRLLVCRDRNQVEALSARGYPRAGLVSFDDIVEQLALPRVQIEMK